MKRQRPYQLFRLMLLLALFGGTGVFSEAAAQAPLIEYTSAGDITKAYGTSAFVLKVTFAGNCAGTQVAVELPTGVTYAGGLAATANTTSGITIAHNAGASTPSKPAFNVSGTIAAGNVLEFLQPCSRLQRRAGLSL